MSRDFASYAAMMVGAYRASPDVRLAVDAWDATGRPTSEWPGWVDIIGPYEGDIERPKRRELTATVRVAVAQRYGLVAGAGWTEFPCHWCGRPGKASWLRTGSQPLGYVSLWDLEWDHLMPVSRGGPDVPHNIVWSCPPCNHRRNNRLPAEFAATVVPWAG